MTPREINQSADDIVQKLAKILPQESHVTKRQDGEIFHRWYDIQDWSNGVLTIAFSSKAERITSSGNIVLKHMATGLVPLPLHELQACEVTQEKSEHPEHTTCVTLKPQHAALKSVTTWQYPAEGGMKEDRVEEDFPQVVFYFPNEELVSEVAVLLRRLIELSQK